MHPQLNKTAITKIPLWLLVTFSLIGYIVIQLWFPLTPYLDQIPPMDIRKFAPTLIGGLGYGLLLLILFGLYALSYQRSQLLQKPLQLGYILIATILFCLPLIQTYPFNATDIYRYIIRGRVNSIYHANSYTSAPTDFPEDPFFPFAGEWANETSPYGPAWEMITTAVTASLGHNLSSLLYSFKIIGSIFHLACAFLIWLLLANAPPNQRSAYTILWAWNPALLLTFVVDAHNDVVMIFWLLLGLWIMHKFTTTGGMIVMLLAPLTKPIALLSIPLFFIMGWQRLGSFKTKLRYLLITTAAGIILLVLFFAPFGSPLQLATRLLREASAAPGFSLPTLILLIFVAFKQIPPIDAVVLLASAAFILFAIWLAWRTWNGRSAVRGTADIFAGYMIQALSFRIWYATWPFPWLLVDDGLSDSKATGLSYPLKVGLWFLVTSQLSVLIYGHIRHYLLGTSQLHAHLLGIPFTFLLPFLLARLSWPFSKKQFNG